MNVLLVCTGNTCRSPMAAAILRQLARGRDVEVRSAGTGALPGGPPAAEATRVAERHGLSLAEHRTTTVDAGLLSWADHVLVMEPQHKRIVERMGAPEKVTLLSEYGGDGSPIPDPLGAGEEAYESVFQAFERYLDNFLHTEERPKTLASRG